MTRYFGPIIILLILLQGCAKKREQTFVQGQGTNLDLIQNWNDKSFDLDTGNVIAPSATSTAEGEVKISPNAESMNHYDLVEIIAPDSKYKSLLGNPPFRGKPNTHGVYQIKIKVTQNYLKFYKVALPQDLPFDERFYTEENLSDGRIAIPVLGYKIKSFYRVENQLTPDDQESHRLMEIEEPNMALASHVKIDWSARELFQATTKVNLLPAQLFLSQNLVPHEWYYSETITEKTLTDTKTIVGESSYRDESSLLSPASKVMVVPRENELRIVNVARDERLGKDQIKAGADINSEAALIIPVEWVDYRTKAQGTGLGMNDELAQDRKWNQRKFFLTDFSSLQSAAVSSGITRLLDVEVDRNYFSFTVLNLVGNKGKTIHYSFLRTDQDRVPYTPKQSNKSDQKLFGYFTTQKPYISNWEYYTEEDFSRRLMLSRMNPAIKEVTFHLSTDSPVWLDDVAEKAVLAWDKAFDEALKASAQKIRIRFSRDRVKLGDLRYHIIHLVDTLNEDGLLGFGPSITDPDTGEIISATTNVYVNSIQSIAASSIRSYVIARLEKRAGNTSGAMLDTQIAQELAKNKALTDAVLNDQRTMDNVKADLNRFKTGQCIEAENEAQSTSDRDIEKFCPEVATIVTQNMNPNPSRINWQGVWDQSKTAINNCSKTITKEKLLSTLIHELGHNFGLRHNFYGSYDKANFKKMTTIFGETILAQSSSIMEYTAWDEDRLTEAGPYDIAAIRFAYGNQVELKDGSIHTLTTSDQDLKSLQLKPYLYCTDEEAFLGLNPLCRMNDSGTNPKEIVDFYIRNFERLRDAQKYRRAKQNITSADAYANYVNQNTFLPLRALYDEWRYKLGLFVKKQNQYLTDYNEIDFGIVLKAMSNDPKFAHDYQDFYEASVKIYQFFNQIADGLNQYCVIEDKGKKKVIEFEHLRDLLRDYSQNTVSIHNCLDAANFSSLSDVLKLGAPKVLSELGYPVHSYRFNLPENLEENLIQDVLGNEAIRVYAGLMINARLNTPKNILNEFKPNMTDEPPYSEEQKSKLLGRIVNGVSFDPSTGIKGPQIFFTQENVIVKNHAKQFLYGLPVPGARNGTINQVATQRRIDPFRVYVPKPGEKASDFTSVLSQNNRLLYATHDESEILSDSLIRRYNKTNFELTFSSPQFVLTVTQLKKTIPSESQVAQAQLESLLVYLNTVSELQKTFGKGTVDYFQSILPFAASLRKLYPLLVADFAQAQTKGQSAIDEFAKRNLLDYVRLKIPGDRFPFSQDSLAPYYDAVEKVNQNQSELESQNSLILEVLNTYAL